MLAIILNTAMQCYSQKTYQPTWESIDSRPVPAWFEDAKFGIFIHWGLWSVAGWAPKKEKGAMYPDWYELRLHTDSAFIKYHEKNWGKDFTRDDFIPLFTAREYNPEKLAKLGVDAGMKYVVPFNKHHGGFCLWPSTYTLRHAGEMGPKRDLIKPLVESCKKQGLKFGFYFSIEEWEYPIIDAQGNIKPRLWETKKTPSMEELEKRAGGKIPVKDFAKDYIVPQAVEFIDRYDPDLIWYDGEWTTEATDLRTYEISSYYYNPSLPRDFIAWFEESYSLFFCLVSDCCGVFLSQRSGLYKRAKDIGRCGSYLVEIPMPYDTIARELGWRIFFIMPTLSLSLPIL